MVFMTIRFLPEESEKAALACMGNLMQANATTEKSAYYIDKEFTLEKSYTMLSVEGKASIKPTFLRLPELTADLGGGDRERYPIRYKGVLGY